MVVAAQTSNSKWSEFMATGSVRGANKRLDVRIESDGIFIIGETTYTLRDISVGGIRLQENLESARRPGDLLNGRVGISRKGIRIYSDVICQVINDDSEPGARLKFIETSEEFTEFLRSSTLRSAVPTEHKAGWIGSNSYQISAENGVETNKSLINRLFRIETIVGLSILIISLVLLMRTPSQQSFWIVAQHEIQSTVSGEITSLHPDSEISVGSIIANISITTLSNKIVDFPIVSRVRGQTLNWNFNLGDQVVEGDTLGVINLTPMEDGEIKAIISFKSPLLSLKPGDVVKVSNRPYHSMDAVVLYIITPAQAAALTGISPDSFRFEEYFVVKVNAPANESLSGQLSVDVFKTWVHRFSTTLWLR